jgi:hypothetical protein
LLKVNFFGDLRPQDIELVAKCQHLDFQRSSRSEQSDPLSPDQSAEFDHRAEASRDWSPVEFGLRQGSGHHIDE